uniref:tumor necrosis factor receptor superfamily member 5 isoform X2 n=1 Tax=Scatophagus argus TaxID=75038 RepID=UPI001ED7F4A9|nr:tumor necrosis factor receptor superfamily member 5 isoform X2 [Scatophagus argus]
MAMGNCTAEDKYHSKDGRCCDRCHAGSYMKAECDSTKETECAECGRGLYTATKNHLNKCHICRDCSSNNNQRKLRDCTAQEDTVCECVAGYYCNNDQCDHCNPVTRCPPGEGVKVQAARATDTICVPCGDGTYSNVTDFHSPCRAHTRCEDIGRLLKTPGTQTSDANCGDFKYNCQWMLPAALWSGLVLTAFVLFAFICWRKKRTSYRAATCVAPVTLVDVLPAAADCPLDLPFAPTETKSYCQESCTMDGCVISLFEPVDKMGSVDAQDSVDSCLPITPLKPSVSFAESSHGNGSTGYCTSNFARTSSEPQEDEWCGT